MEHSNKIEGIGFENFRIFKEHTKFDFRNLTILTGTNNSGKSTIINGIRLIKENFSELKVFDVPETFKLENLFNAEFNVGDIIKRYGNLQKFVSFNSEKNQFSFSMQNKMRMMDDTADIKFTVEVQENSLRNGKLVKLEMVSNKSGLTIFSINKNASSKDEDSKTHLVSRIDLNFFYNHFTDWVYNSFNYRKEIIKLDNLVTNLNEKLIDKSILITAINKANKKYNAQLILMNNNGYFLQDVTDDIDRWLKEINEIVFTLNEGRFYDFSILWAYDVTHKELFKKLIENIYGKYNNDVLSKLTKDIISYLSAKNWQDDIMNEFYNNSLEKLGLSHLYFRNTKATEDISGLSLQYFSGHLDDSQIAEKYKYFLNEDTILEINDKEELIDYLAILLIERCNYEPQIYRKKDVKDQVLKVIRKDRYKSSIAECYFYNEFIFHNLNLINKSFLPFLNTEFISTDRTNSKRVKSLLDEDDISKLSLKLFSFKPKQFNEIIEFINHWLREFEIAKEIIFEKDPESENFKILIKREKELILLSDMGYGVSQLIPIILACYPLHEFDFAFQGFSIVQKVIAVEEPETNLHPALQSKLADFFIEASKKFNIQFIIETHSEYLIRKLQYLTAKGKVKKEDIIIYYFYHPDKLPSGEDQVKKIEISDDGGLTNEFGTGFFDEADNIALDLFLMNKTQKN